MAEDVENIIIEQLRAIRSEIADLRGEIGEVKKSQASTSRRIDELSTFLHGLNYVVTASVGSFMSDVDDLKTRVAELEKPRS